MDRKADTLFKTETIVFGKQIGQFHQAFKVDACQSYFLLAFSFSKQISWLSKSSLLDLASNGDFLDSSLSIKPGLHTQIKLCCRQNFHQQNSENISHTNFWDLISEIVTHDHLPKAYVS